MKSGLSGNTIATIHTIFQHYPGIEKAVLYGSRAKGTCKQGSDIDLTLYGNTLTTTDLMNIASDLDDSYIPYMVDVSLFHRLDNPGLKEHIQRVGVVFYERTKAPSE